MSIKLKRDEGATLVLERISWPQAKSGGAKAFHQLPRSVSGLTRRVTGRVESCGLVISLCMIVDHWTLPSSNLLI